MNNISNRPDQSSVFCLDLNRKIKWILPKGNIDFQDFIAIMQKQREYVDSEDEILEAFRYLMLLLSVIMLLIFYISIPEYLMLMGLAESLPRSYERFWQVWVRSWQRRKWRSCSAKARLTRTGWLITTPSVKPFSSKHWGPLASGLF